MLGQPIAGHGDGLLRHSRDMNQLLEGDLKIQRPGDQGGFQDGDIGRSVCPAAFHRPELLLDLRNIFLDPGLQVIQTHKIHQEADKAIEQIPGCFLGSLLMQIKKLTHGSMGPENIEDLLKPDLRIGTQQKAEHHKVTLRATREALTIRSRRMTSAGSGTGLQKSGWGVVLFIRGHLSLHTGRNKWRIGQDPLREMDRQGLPAETT